MGAIAKIEMGKLTIEISVSIGLMESINLMIPTIVMMDVMNWVKLC